MWSTKIGLCPGTPQGRGNSHLQEVQGPAPGPIPGPVERSEGIELPSKLSFASEGGKPGICNLKPAICNLQSGVNIQRLTPISGCFIATTCCGSADCAEVLRLKRFRDTHLVTNRWGRACTRFYYRLSPACARWLARHPSLCRIIRVLAIRPLSRILDTTEPDTRNNEQG